MPAFILLKPAIYSFTLIIAHLTLPNRVIKKNTKSESKPIKNNSLIIATVFFISELLKLIAYYGFTAPIIGMSYMHQSDYICHRTRPI